MNAELLSNIVGNAKFGECINEAAPYRVKIIQDLQPQMKELQERYIELLEKANYRGISNTLKKLRLDKKDPDAKSEYKNWKRRCLVEFKLVLKTLDHEFDAVPSVSTVYATGSILKYIDKQALIDQALSDRSVIVTIPTLETLNAKFVDNDLKIQIKEIFNQALECQNKIQEAQDAISVEIYEKLPSELIFDSKTNKSGLKTSNFNALVRHKAVGILKSAYQYTKYLSQQVNNTNANIDREEIMLGKTRQL